VLTIHGKKVRLEWLPENGGLATRVVREGVAK
jgi:hypothetical protein